MMDRETIEPKVKKIPGSNAKKWVSYHMKYASLSTYNPYFVWDRKAPAIGPFLTDVDSNIIMDFCSHVGSAPLGYNNPALTAMSRELGGIDPDRYAGADFISGYGHKPDLSLPTPSHLHHKLIEITKQFRFDQAFLVSTGTEAVENAIKLCYQARKNYGYGICFDGAFHGRTLGALSLNRSKWQHRAFYPQVPKVISFPYPLIKDKNNNQWYKTGRKGEKISVLAETLSKDCGTIKPEEISYIIIEPVQGEGGYNVPTPDAFREVFDIAQQHDIPIISDEIQAGMGRTGKWWACENFGVKPDMICAGKALRVAAAVGKKDLFPKEDGRVSSTWAEGNAISTAVGYKTIEIIQKERLLDNAIKMGKILREKLEEIQQKNPQHITDVRGIGLMDAFEISDAKKRKKILYESLKRGLLLAPCGHKTIRVLPPLDVKEREINLFSNILEDSMKKLK
ncbi:aminotransferase class III-fold pyridoxal phosphate-dependent enzyme [Candidatus Woesearchaeota archaeon]|nr:aminotransferase class III-fold pyridoxal phosphate-dependent enzyme [Candidatus Woesearchaeota archaeon]